MKRSSAFLYGLETWTTELPARAWTPADETVGGMRVAGSGIPAGYIARRDDLLDLTLRLNEDEYDTLRALIAYGQAQQSFTWLPDADGSLGNVVVYLVSPAPGEKWAPTRSTEYPRVFELTLTLRAVTQGTSWPAYFE